MVSTKSLVKYLRDSVMVQDPTIGNDDTWLAMTDEDLEMVLLVAKSRDFPNESFTNIKSGIVFPLILLGKKELYYRLATKSAPKYDLKSDDGELTKSQRFDHFYALIKQVELEYENYMDNGYYSDDGIGDLEDGVRGSKIKVHNFLLTSRYYSRRNYNLYKAPVVSVFASSVSTDSCSITWNTTGIRNFTHYTVYVHTEEILDETNGDSINPQAKFVTSTYDFRKSACAITDLLPQTRYYILVVCHEANGIKGYGGIVFETSEE